MDFKKKYFKYKKKYLELKKQIGSGRFLSLAEAGVVPKAIAKVSTKIEGPISSKIEGPVSYYYLSYNDKRFLMMGDVHIRAKNCYDESGITVVNYIKNILEENKGKKCIDFFLESEYYGSFNLDERSDEFLRTSYSKSRNKSNGSTKHIFALRDFFLVNHNQNDYFRFHETDIRQTLLDKMPYSSFYRMYKGLISLRNYPDVPKEKWTDKQKAFFSAGYHPNLQKQIDEKKIMKKYLMESGHHSIIEEVDNEIEELEKEIAVFMNESINEVMKELDKNEEKKEIKESRISMVKKLIAIMEYYIGNNELTKEKIKKILEIFSPNDEITYDDIKDEIKMKYFFTKQKIKCDQSIVNIIIKEIIESFKKEILDKKNAYNYDSKSTILDQFAVKMVDLYTLLRMFRIGYGSSRKGSIKGCSDNEFKNIIGYYGNRHTKNMVNILQKIGAKLIFEKENIVDGKKKQCLDIGDFVPFQDVKEGQSQVELKD